MSICYINSVGCISIQNTSNNDEFLDDIVQYDTNVIHIIAPNYKEYIKPVAARRMAKGVKMGVVASSIALKEAEISMPDAIITGTGMGCVRDSEKFVSNIIDNNEEFLTPTSFIQSTHNTVGAQIALGLQCKSYNFTYVHEAVSFESSLIDAHLTLQEDETSTILVGGIDELGEHTTKLHELVQHVKQKEVATLDLLNSKSTGTIFGEGAAFFVLSDKKQESTYAQLKDVEIISSLKMESLEDRVNHFLKRNGVSIDAIDAVVLGNNGDVAYDIFYNELQSGVFTNTQQLCYKHLFGEFNTVSSFGLWIASKVLKTQKTPAVLRVNSIEPKTYKNILLYNQYRGENHSLVLIGAC